MAFERFLSPVEREESSAPAVSVDIARVREVLAFVNEVTGEAWTRDESARALLLPRPPAKKPRIMTVWDDQD
jgi:hypothetical protein